MDDASATAAKRCALTVGANDRWSGKTRLIEIVRQACCGGTAGQQLIFRAGASELCPVFADAKNIRRIRQSNCERTAGLNNRDSVQLPPSQNSVLQAARWTGKHPGSADDKTMCAIGTRSAPALLRRCLVSAVHPYAV